MQEDFEKLLKFCNEPLQTPYHKSLKLYVKIWKRVGEDGKGKILSVAENTLKPIADAALKCKTSKSLCTFIADEKIHLYLSSAPKKDAPKFSLSMFATKAIREEKHEKFAKLVSSVLAHINPKVKSFVAELVEESKDDEVTDPSNLIQRIIGNLDPSNPEAALSMIDDLGDANMSANLRATLEEIKGLKGADKAASKEKIKALVSTLVSGVVDNYM